MLTSQDMERQLELLPVEYHFFKHPAVEYGKGVWQGTTAYKYLRDKYPFRVPYQREFISEYLNRTIHLFPKEMLMLEFEFIKLGLKCRATRSYFALVREEHCITRMSELFPREGISVVYDFDNDWKNGVDVVLLDHETKKKHYVHLFVDTPEARKFREHKEKRVKGRDFSKHVDFPFNKKEGKRVGKFWLYSDDQILTFMKKLRTDYKDKGEEWNGEELPLSS